MGAILKIRLEDGSVVDIPALIGSPGVGRRRIGRV